MVKPTDDEDFFFRNVNAFEDAKLGFNVPEDTVLWKYISDFAKAHAHAPTISTVRNHFTHIGELEVVDRLDVVSNMPPLTRGNFVVRLEDKAEDRRKSLMTDLLRDAGTILTSGLEIREEKGKKRILKGPRDACYHIMDQSHEIVAPTQGMRLSGEVTAAADEVKEAYEHVKADPMAGIGLMTGIQQIDECMKGAKKKEFWIHAAFTGGLKSTFLLNWLYNQSVYYRTSTLMFSLEMPFEQCLNMLYVMHSFHEKFKPVRAALGLQSDPDAELGLDYMDIKFGELEPEEERFFLEHVIPDFKDEKNGYGNIHIEVGDPSKMDTNMEDIRRRAERLYAKSPFSMIAIDHLSLMSSVRNYSNTTDRLNEVCRMAKLMALYFNRGMGMAVVGLFQIGREAYKNALKSKEKTGTPLYNLTSLSYANEAERSADIITSSWCDEDLEKQNRAQFQNLKARDLAKFAIFLARVEWGPRRVLTCADPFPGQQVGSKEEPEIDEVLDSV